MKAVYSVSIEMSVGSVGEGRSEQRPEGDKKISQVVSLEKGVLYEGENEQKTRGEASPVC